MDFSALKRIFADNGCLKVYGKILAANDNSKNQVYLGGSFELLNIFPIGSIQTETAGDWKRERFKATLPFSWIGPDGQLFPAPGAQLILYPKYPEVRLSGFLQGCDCPPSELMTQRLAGRILFLSVAASGTVLGYVTSPDSTIATQFRQLQPDETEGVFTVIELPAATNNLGKLLEELQRINRLGWITAKRLDRHHKILPCPSPNCGGYTLEAELDITPNGYSEPDFLGWEVKQFSVSNFKRTAHSVITLMTPEPTTGYYKTDGVEAFIHRYGYGDKRGRVDRKNFGGVHRAGEIHKTTGLTLVLPGFDSPSGKIRNASGMIALVDGKDNVAAGWSFSELLKHWNRKHNQACYIPSMRSGTVPRQYCYGSPVMLGKGTSFDLFLQAMAARHIVYDPGIKLEGVSTATPTTKRRSQFRIKSGELRLLYRKTEYIDLDMWGLKG
jgi:hypothetical protein